MTTKRKIFYSIIALSLVIGVAFFSVASVKARGPIEICDNGVDDDGDGEIDEAACRISTTGTPTSTTLSIVPEYWGDNPSCQDIGFGFGFKIEGQGASAYTGTFTFTDADGKLTGGAINDPGNSVTLSSDGYYLDWSSTISLDAVIMKGGPNSNVYIYDPEAFSDTDLAPPNAPGDDALSHVEFCFDYELDVTKTAAGTYDNLYEWEITKTVDPESQSGFAGDTLSWTWEITWNSVFVTQANHEVSGEIIINNPAPFPVDFSVDDVIEDGLIDITAAVTCPSYQVPASGSITCTYVSTDVSGDETLNTATVTSLTNGVEGDTATAEIGWTGTDVIPEITSISDSNNVDIPVGETQPFQYTGSHTCEADDLSIYGGDGTYDGSAYNEATITWDGGSDSDDATTTYDCYLWDVSKTANGTYNDRYAWDISKTVDPESQSGFAGDELSWTWSITWNSYFVSEENHAVSGVITVTNPADIPLTVDVTDYLTGPFTATVDCDGAGGTSLTVAANSFGTCDYSAAPGSQLAQNTATATRNSVAVSDTVDVNWVQGPDAGLDATISDSNNVDIPVGETQPFQYTGSHTCEADDLTVYDGDGTYDGSAYNEATITWDGGSDSDDATTTYDCYLWDVSKTANGTFNDRYAWDISKTVDPESQSGFAGDELSWTWSITWNSYFVSEENHAVSGVITVDNPADIELTVDVTDYLTGMVAAAVTCNDADGGTDLTVAAGGSGTCNYTAAPDSQLEQNTATVTRNGVTVSDTVDVTWVQGPDAGVDASISDSNHEDIPVDSAQPYTYPGSHTCEAEDLTVYDGDGTYDGSAYNEATITWDGGSDSDDATTTYDCYLWDVSKTAEGTYNDQYRWEVYKTVDPLSQSGFAGETLEWTWEITWKEFLVGEENHAVSGVITVNNPAPLKLTVDVTDYLTGPFAATVTCNDSDGGTDLTIDANSSDTCGYTAAPGSQLAENTAEATRNGVTVADTVDVNWTQLADQGRDATITDDSGISIPEDTAQPYTYSDEHTCEAEDLTVYDGNYTYDGSASNEATITWDGGSDSDDATTTYDCYIPSIEKTAEGTYDERHEWDVEKTVSPTLQGGYPGDVLPWTWTVNVYENVIHENFDVAGTITVVNPNPEDTLYVTLTDILDDGTVPVPPIAGGIAADIDWSTCQSTTPDGPVLVVAPGTSETCNYTANDLDFDDVDDVPVTNIARFWHLGVFYYDTETIEWTANQIRENATLTDDEGPLNESLTGHAQAGSYTFGPYEYDDSYTCSSNRADYFVESVYTQMTDTIINWAYVHSDGEERGKDDAETTWTCDASFVDIYKTTNGQPADPTKDIAFALWSGTTKLETVSTLNNGANLSFQTALVPGDTYTICESPVPAGYTFEISVDGGNVLTYAGPPGEENPTGEIQCFDFTAPNPDTQVTVTFNVNNSYPGGAPRTPGYWKNWNRCSGGNQADTADKLNDYLGPVDGAGVYLLDDLLPQTIGSLEITTCEDGVLILSAYSLTSKPKNMANDAAYTLARALLAARLNQDAGACVPLPFDPPLEYGDNTFDSFEQILTAADGVLSQVAFDGTGGYLGPKNKKAKDLAAYALWLYEIIDDYNNGYICTGDPSH